jgi:hypothetical protein
MGEDESGVEQGASTAGNAVITWTESHRYYGDIPTLDTRT